MELNFEAYDYNYYKDEEGNLLFEDGPYRSVKIVNNSDKPEYKVVLGKRNLMGTKTKINRGGAGKGKDIEEDIDICDVEVSVKGKQVEYAKQNVDNANGDKEIIIKDVEPLDSDDEGYFKIEAGENELFDKIYLNIRDIDSDIIGGGTLNPVDSGNDQGGSQDDNGSGNDNVDLSLYTENSKIEDVGDFGYVNYSDVDKSDDSLFGHIASYSIYPSGENVAMKRADVKLCMRLEDNLRQTVTANGEYPINVPNGKDFIRHGVIDVQVPSDVNVANNLGFQVTGSFSPEAGAGNMMVSTHTLTLNNASGGSEYDAMESANVTVKLNKKTIDETYTENKTYTINPCSSNEFFNGGTITVDVPEKEIASSLGFQVSGNFHAESGAGNMMVSNHTLTLNNASSGSDYDGMESASVSVRLSKKEIDETYDENGTYTINPCNSNEFFNGGTITVNVPEKEIANSLNFQVSGDYHEEGGASDMMVSTHTLNLNNSPQGSNYDGMKSAVVNVKLNKKSYSRTITNNGSVSIPGCSNNEFFTGGSVTVNVKPKINYIYYNYDTNDSDNLSNLSSVFSDIRQNGNSNDYDWKYIGGPDSQLYTQSGIPAGKADVYIVELKNSQLNLYYVVFLVISSRSNSVGGGTGQEADYLYDTNVNALLSNNSDIKVEGIYKRRIDRVINYVELCEGQSGYNDLICGSLKDMINSKYKVFESSIIREDLFRIGCFI